MIVELGESHPWALCKHNKEESLWVLPLINYFTWKLQNIFQKLKKHLLIENLRMFVFYGGFRITGQSWFSNGGCLMEVFELCLNCGRYYHRVITIYLVKSPEFEWLLYFFVCLLIIRDFWANLLVFSVNANFQGFCFNLIYLCTNLQPINTVSFMSIHQCLK